MRSHGREIDVAFAAELTAKQGAAVSVMLAHDDGILVTPPGSGKTVIAYAVIAERVPPPLPSPTGNPWSTNGVPKSRSSSLSGPVRSAAAGAT
jgi:hypothetical protein